MYRFQPDTDGAAGADNVPGSTVIQDSVIGKVIGLAASSVPGVYALGDSTTRALGMLREVIGTADASQGVTVTNAEGVVSVTAVIVVEYPHPVHEVADAVRREIANAVTVLLGMSVGDIDVTVNDVHVADASAADAPASGAAAAGANDSDSAAEPAGSGHTGTQDAAEHTATNEGGAL
ncbi:Asp23/Gls24 family envelope stress response protein [Plantibacter sp. YIM 135347]|uniref:Asp23/Gls24 family envelope stress response protein n=1 Tax=Plantibacter sp. YIM 135347 TaxID=3423919 RepID=UPI003D34091E